MLSLEQTTFLKNLIHGKIEYIGGKVRKIELKDLDKNEKIDITEIHAQILNNNQFNDSHILKAMLSHTEFIYKNKHVYQYKPRVDGGCYVNTQGYIFIGQHINHSDKKLFLVHGRDPIKQHVRSIKGTFKENQYFLICDFQLPDGKGVNPTPVEIEANDLSLYESELFESLYYLNLNFTYPESNQLPYVIQWNESNHQYKITIKDQSSKKTSFCINPHDQKTKKIIQCLRAFIKYKVQAKNNFSIIDRLIALIDPCSTETKRGELGMYLLVDNLKPNMLPHTLLPSAVVLSAIFVSTGVIAMPIFSIALMSASALGALALQVAIYQNNTQNKSAFLQNPWVSHNTLAFGLALIAYLSLMTNPLAALIAISTIMTLAPLASVMSQSLFSSDEAYATTGNTAKLAA